MIAPVLELLAEVRRLGVTLVAVGERLRCRPIDRLSPELIAQLRDRKADVLAALAGTVGVAKPTADDIATSVPAERSESEAIAGNRPCIEAVVDANVIDPDELTPCAKCGTLESWQTLAGNWRCLRCDPPTASRRLAEFAEVRRRLKDAK